MRTADLIAEYEAGAAVTPYDLDLPEQVIAGDMVREARIWLDGDLWLPDPAGVPAYITPVEALEHDLVVQIAPSHPTTLIDLIAWHPNHPERWALRTGLGRVLGYVGWWGDDNKPVQVFRTPLAWLRGHCRGVVVLTRDPVERRDILMELPGLIAEDRRHASELRAACEHPYPAPAISVTA